MCVRTYNELEIDSFNGEMIRTWSELKLFLHLLMLLKHLFRFGDRQKSCTTFVREKLTHVCVCVCSTGGDRVAKKPTHDS